MLLEDLLSGYPRKLQLKTGFCCSARPLKARDEEALYKFFLAVPEQERMFSKRRITDQTVVHEWCRTIDYDHNLPLLAVLGGRIIGVATLHQQQGGWKRHIGRVNVLVHPEYRGRGLARALIGELVEIARHIGLEKVEAEFTADQEHGIQVFALLGFSELLRLPNYVRDMQADRHDYVLMGLDLVTDEEYAGAG